MSVLSKVLPLEEQGLAPNLRQGVGDAIEDVQLRGVTLIFSVAPERIKGPLRHLGVEGLDGDCRARQHVVKFGDSRWTMSRLQDDPAFQDGYC